MLTGLPAQCCQHDVHHDITPCCIAFSPLYVIGRLLLAFLKAQLPAEPLPVVSSQPHRRPLVSGWLVASVGAERHAEAVSHVVLV